MTFEELFETQNEIIRMQSDIIDSMFMRLAQILTVEELEFHAGTGADADGH